MKDENGIEICCENCDDFIPVGTNSRGCTLYEEDCEYVFGGERCVFKASSEAYEARIQELQIENALLKDGESHVMNVKMSPKFVKSITRMINSEIENLKEELGFTDEELNLIRDTFQSEIREDKCGWSAEKRIIAKCNELLNERKEQC